MALPDFDMRQLLEAGVHFGHQTHRWNPKMEPYIFGDRNGIHVIDLSKSVPLLHQALVAVRDVVTAGGRVLFVGTKRQAADPVAQYASQCAQYYMNSRWLGGTLTNWKTISNSIKRLRELEDLISGDGVAGNGAKAGDGAVGLTKKEVLNLTRERDKLERALGGIKDMGGVPELMFVIDTNKEAIAIAEAKTLGIPVVAILDTNSNPDNIDYPIPGNDDAARAIELYCNLISKAVLDGIEESNVGTALGAAEAAMMETAEAAQTETKGETAAKTKPAPKSKSKAAKTEKAKAKAVEAEKAEAKQPEAEKAEAKQPEAEKAEAKQPEPEKAEAKQPEPEKAEAKQPESEKAEAKQPEKSVASESQSETPMREGKE